MSAEEPCGPMILREKPRTSLVDRLAFAIPEDASAEDIASAADWIKFYGGVVKYADRDGLLVTSGDPDDLYHEWITTASLIVLDEHGQFTEGCYGIGMADHYLIEPTTEADL